MKSSFSRRSFLRDSALFAGAASLPLPVLARAERQTAPVATAAGVLPPVVEIGSNEHPDGPSPAALQAIAAISPRGGRYLHDIQLELLAELSQQLGVGMDSLMPYAGSTEPLDYTVLAFTSPQRSLVTANPSYEQSWHAAGRNGAAVHKVLLRKDGSHDVQAMCGKDANAGVIYICNPNNPTGSVTARKDIEYALAHKPKGCVLVLDEAYIHFADSPVSGIDLVAAGEDVVVLRTFSKLYGMAGIRLGYAAARPQLLAKLKFYSINSLPVTAAAAGLASLRDPQLVPIRRARNRLLREDVAGWLTAKGYVCSPSESNCFMVDVKQPAQDFIEAMASHGVIVGRSWEGFPTQSRITVGNAEEMTRFKQAFVQVEAGKRGPYPLLERHRLAEHFVGQTGMPIA